MPGRRAWIRRFIRWSFAGLVVALLLLLTPVAYVELACRGDARAQPYEAVITDPAFVRREANTYLTYPEWHIVYAYDGLAEALRTGDEHAFAYASSVAGFWRSTCALTRVADEHGGADAATRLMIHIIGVSFTAEMALKAAYEESVGRAVAWLRGPTKTPQDEAIAATSADYAAFLRQTPWYGYPFGRERRRLWEAPVDGLLRGWERRIAIGAELTAKSVYARLIARAAGAAPAPQVIRSLVSGLDESVLARIPHVMVVAARAGGIEIETPRYALFTRVLADIAGRGGVVGEIAGNDDIMVALTAPPEHSLRVEGATVIARMRRDGFRGERVLVGVKVTDLSPLLLAYPLADAGASGGVDARLEHVFDY